MATPEGAVIDETLTLNGGATDFLYLGRGAVIYIAGVFGTATVVIQSTGKTIFVEELAAKTINFSWKVPSDTPKGMVIRPFLATVDGTTSLSYQVFQAT